jgi:hypothetical protein
LTGIGRADIARCGPTDIAKYGATDIARYVKDDIQGYVGITKLSTCAGIARPIYLGLV